MNTLEGGKLASKTMRERHGDDFWVRIGKLGGAVRSPKKGFGGMSPAKLRAISRKGGKAGKRKPVTKD